MNNLTTQEKVSLIIEMCKKHEITSYEIGENTTVSNVAAHNILNKITKTPRSKTLNVILEYIENKITGKSFGSKKTTGAYSLQEDRAEYNNDLQKILKILNELKQTIRIDHDAIAEAIKRIYFNTEDLKENGIDISSSITSLISAINDSSNTES